MGRTSQYWANNMLTDLLKVAGVSLQTGNGFFLDKTFYSLTPALAKHDAFLFRDFDNNVWLRAWNPQGMPVTELVEFGFVGEELVLAVRTTRILCDELGKQLMNIYYMGHDHRICNRLRARELLK